MKQDIGYYFITIVSRFIGRFVLLFALARIANLNDFGLFTYSLTFSAILVLILDYGYNIKALKDMSKDVCNISTYVSRAFLLKLVVFALVFIFYYLFDLNTLLNIKDNEKDLLLMFFCISLLSSLANLFLLPYKATRRFNVEAKYVSIDNIISLILIVTLYYYYSLENAIIGYLVFKALLFIVILFEFKREYKLKLDVYSLVDEFKSASIYAVYEIVGGLYLMIDTLIMKVYLSNEDIAIYQIGIRLLFGAQIILSIVNSVFLPRLSSYYRHTQFFTLAIKLNRLFFVFAIICSILLYLFIHQIVLLLFGEGYLLFLNIAIYFILIILLRYMSSIYSVLLIVGDKQIIRVLTLLIVTSCLIICDLIVIPLHGIEGAAMSLLVAHFLILVTYMFFVYREYRMMFFVKT
jgi:O-antigen/teichoic acid export membrane protein